MRPNLQNVAEAASPFHERHAFSPLVLADRLITLAQEADRAGYVGTANRLIGLVYAVLDDEVAPSIAA